MSIADAVYIHKHRGTPAALTRFADRLGVGISYGLNDRVGNSPATIVIFIHPPILEIATVLWVEYVARVIRRLIPGWLNIGAIHVLPLVETQSYSTSILSAWQYGFIKLEVT